MEKRLLPTALYCRLSREDGDRMESDSIGNQRKLLEAYIENHPELVMPTTAIPARISSAPPFSGCCGTWKVGASAVCW